MNNEGATPLRTEETTAGRTLNWLLPLVLFLGLFGVYAVTAARDIVSIDAHAASVEAWKIGAHGTPWLSPHDLKEFPRDRWLSQAPNGHLVAQRMAGPILLGVPAYWLLNMVSGVRVFSLLPAGLAAAGVTAAAGTLMFLALRRHAAGTLALIGALAFALATPTWSVSANGLWTHTITQFAIAGAALSLAGRRWWLAGIFLAVGMWGRPHVAVIAAVAGLGLCWNRRQTRPALGLGIPTLASLGGLVLWNHFIFGPWTIGGAYGDGRIAQAAEGYGGSGSAEQLLNYLGFFFSANKGLFVWTPVLLVLIPAVVRAWRGIPAWAKWLALGGVAYTFFQLRLNYFAGGDTFYGYRHGLELLTCVTPLVTFAVSRAGGWARLIVPPVVGAQFAAMTVGSVVDGFFLPIGRVWSDNSFDVALRTQPVVVGAWLAACVVLGIWASLVWRRRGGVGTPFPAIPHVAGVAEGAGLR